MAQAVKSFRVDQRVRRQALSGYRHVEHRLAVRNRKRRPHPQHRQHYGRKNLGTGKTEVAKDGKSRTLETDSILPDGKKYHAKYVFDKQ